MDPEPPINGWLDEPKWREAQRIVPIACVDILALRRLQDIQQGSQPLVGLIFRETPHEGRRWCLIGGRIRKNERLAAAVRRHVYETLGHAVDVELPKELRPLYVAEYLTDARPGEFFDPRQHAVALTYALPVAGTPQAQGEALSFRWFDPLELPAPHEFGFDQDKVVAACLAHLTASLHVQHR